MRQMFWIAFLAGAIVMAFLAAPAAFGAEVREQIVASANRYGVDPELALAIAKVESNFSQEARGTHGEVGIYQLMPRFHKHDSIYSTAGNIDAGVRQLARVQRTCTSRYGAAYFICYNLGENYPKKIKYPKLFPYYRRVRAVAGTL